MSQLDIIGAMPKKTEILFEKIANENDLEDFVLAGGTALAIYIKHRTSEDLDFFINKNIISNVIKRKIDTLIERLSKEYIITEIQNVENEQINYMFGDVKVTFLASPLKLLDDANSYKNINIASIDKIAAGKLYTILKYRIKSRDFYDIKYIMKHHDFSLGDIFDLMKKHYGKVNFSQDLIIKRFLKMPLNIDDEGFESLELKEKETFKTLRNFFKDQIKNLDSEKHEIFNFSKEDVEKNINKKYGLLRQSLLMELFNISKHEVIYQINLVKIDSDLFYQDINGKTIFHLVYEDTKFFEYLLYHIKTISDNIKVVCEISGNDKALELIEFHRVVNRCLDKNQDEIKQIVKNKDISYENINSAIKRKNEIFEGTISDGISMIKSLLTIRKY